MRRQTTKELLAASFLELAQKKPIDKITITQITDNCGMSQPTFYHHFRDKYDLISFIHSENLSRIIAEAAEDRGGWKKASADCARYYKANRVYILNACNAPGIRETYIMNIERINEKFFLATEDGEQPKTRPVSFQMYYNGKLYFTVGKHKEVYSQIVKNPQVEVCGFKGADIVRIWGKAVVDDDPALFEKAKEVLPLLGQIYNDQTGLKAAVFTLEDAKAEYSNMVDYSLKKAIEL